MSIDTTAPRTRRAIIAGAFGAVLGSMGLAAKPAEVRAGTDGDVVLDATNTAAGTTAIVGSGDGPLFRVATSETEDAVHVLSDGAVGIIGASGVAAEDIPDPIAASTGIYGLSPAGHGVYGASDTGIGVYAATNATSVAAIVGEGATYGIGVHGDAEAGVGVRGHGNIGVLGNGFVDALAPAVPMGTGVQGHGGVGVYGSTQTGTGVFGKSGSVAVPFGNVDRAVTGVYGFCGHDANASGVAGETTVGVGTLGIATSGQGVRGEAASGVGVKAVATTGAALNVAGRAVFSRSGRASLPANAKFVDVTVPGGLDSNANVLATLQIKRAKVHVLAARPNQPSAGKVRIYVSDVASTTEATPIAWFVLG